MVAVISDIASRAEPQFQTGGRAQAKAARPCLEPDQPAPASPCLCVRVPVCSVGLGMPPSRGVRTECVSLRGNLQEVGGHPRWEAGCRIQPSSLA